MDLDFWANHGSHSSSKTFEGLKVALVVTILRLCSKEQ